MVTVQVLAPVTETLRLYQLLPCDPADSVAVQPLEPPPDPPEPLPELTVTLSLPLPLLKARPGRAAADRLSGGIAAASTRTAGGAAAVLDAHGHDRGGHRTWLGLPAGPG